jgi:hypothetical protein
MEELRGIGLAKRHLRVPDMGGLRTAAVDFDDLEVPAGPQILKRTVAQVDAGEIQIGDIPDDGVDPPPAPG